MTGTPPAAPSATATPAERVRSVLAASDSLDVASRAGRYRLFGRSTVDTDGRLTIELPATCDLARADGDVPVLLEFTDVAAVAMRGRVRAQVAVHGHLAPVGQRHGGGAGPAGITTVRIQVVCAQLVRGASYAFVDGRDLARAVPDPVATREAVLLLHLADLHRDRLDLLTRLIPVRLLHGARAVHPRRLDRFGIELRVEHPRRDHDVRLRFAAPLQHADQAGDQLHALFRRARHCRRRVS